LHYITPEDKIFANQDHIKMQMGIPVNYKHKYLKNPSNFGDTLHKWLRQPVTSTATEVSHKTQTSANRSKTVTDI